MAQHEAVEFESCYRAVRSKDPRFDGWFFSGVTSTGIYCRPSCPATTPKRENIRFYPSAAAAQKAGFRACKRCRPDAAPGSPEWNNRADVVARAMRLIAHGVVDRKGVAGLASQLGYSSRQLERLMSAELGAGPVSIARAQRAQTARVLVETTDLKMADIAFAAGFASVRQFNDTIRAVFAGSPTQLRKHHRNPSFTATSSLLLRLPFRKPLSPGNLFGHLAATAVPGVEEAGGNCYRRTLRLEHGHAVVELSPTPAYIACKLTLSDLRDLSPAIAKCRWLLDLDADTDSIDQALSRDAKLRPLVERAPGRRVPRTVDGAEIAIRAVLGQQISTTAARTVTHNLVLRYGQVIEDLQGGLTHLFPIPEELCDVEIGIPEKRKLTLRTLAQRLASGDLDLGPGSDRDAAVAALATIDGIGPWTIQTIAMRALGDPDAFLANDLGIRHAAAALGLPGEPRQLESYSESWRPWRAYAVQYLWSTVDHPINHWPVNNQLEEAS